MINKFSIITVVYNAKEELKKTVESIQNQTYKNFEHIIIDGASTDGTFEYIKSLEFNNMRYISEKDNGIYDAMNKGIDVSKGEYLLFLNAGDKFSTEDILDKIVSKINSCKEQPKIIYGGAAVYTQDGKFLSSLKPLDLTKRNLNRYATRVVCHQSIFVHKDSVVKYSDKYRLKSELNWYYNLVNKIDQKYICKTEEIICDYYLGGTGDIHFWENYFERIRVAREHNKLFSFILTLPFFSIPLIFRAKRRIFGK